MDLHVQMTEKNFRSKKKIMYDDIDKILNFFINNKFNLKINFLFEKKRNLLNCLKFIRLLTC
jgi:hypothetical protein